MHNRYWVLCAQGFQINIQASKRKAYEYRIVFEFTYSRSSWVGDGTSLAMRWKFSISPVKFLRWSVKCFIDLPISDIRSFTSLCHIT
jgi:hypothetical protein